MTEIGRRVRAGGRRPALVALDLVLLIGAQISCGSAAAPSAPPSATASSTALPPGFQLLQNATYGFSFACDPNAVESRTKGLIKPSERKKVLYKVWIRATQAGSASTGPAPFLSITVNANSAGVPTQQDMETLATQLNAQGAQDASGERWVWSVAEVDGRPVMVFTGDAKDPVAGMATIHGRKFFGPEYSYTIAVITPATYKRPATLTAILDSFRVSQ